MYFTVKRLTGLPKIFFSTTRAMIDLAYKSDVNGKHKSCINAKSELLFHDLGFQTRNTRGNT